MGHVEFLLDTGTHLLLGYRRSDRGTIWPFAFSISALKSHFLGSWVAVE